MTGQQGRNGDLDRDATRSLRAAAGPLCAADAPGLRRGAGGGRWGSPYVGTDAGRPPSLGETRGEEAENVRRQPRLRTSGRRRFHSLAHAPQAGSFRDADWRRPLRAAVSSGLESHRPSPESGRGDSRKQLGRRLLKGPDDLQTRPAPKGEPFPVVTMRPL